MSRFGKSVEVAVIPMCDVCQQRGLSNIPAIVDAKTVFGSWGYLCQEDFDNYGIGLGTGLGQVLILWDADLAPSGGGGRP